MITTIQNDSIMKRLQQMAQQIELASSQRDLTDLELLMSEMLIEGNKTHTKAVRVLEEANRAIDRAIASALFWRRTSRILSVAVVVLWAACIYVVTR